MPQKQPNEAPTTGRPPPPPAPPRKRTNMDGADAPYPGMAAAFEAHTGQSWSDQDSRRYAAMWAAAWKAATLYEREACANVCETAEVPIDIDVWMGTKKSLTAAIAIGLATEIRKRHNAKVRGEE